MKTFFKELGISLVPVILALLVAITMRLIMDSAFRVLHPSTFSNEVYECCISAMWYVVLSSIIVFIPLMAWRKRKIIAWRLADLGKEDGDNHSSKNGEDDNHSSENGGNGNDGGCNNANNDGNNPAHRGVQVRLTTFAFSITTNVQKWLGVTRHLSCAIVDDVVVGNVHLDIPNEEERKSNDFWKKCDAFIYALWVDGDYRKKNIAMRLLETAEREAKESGCKTVALEWNRKEAEEWVLRWYLHLGYEEKEFGDGISFLVKKLVWDEEREEDFENKGSEDATE